MVSVLSGEPWQNPLKSCSHYKQIWELVNIMGI